MIPARLVGPLHELVRGLDAQFGDRLIAAALYGSQARGTGGPDSDVDLLVIVEGLDERLWSRDREIARLTAPIGPPNKSLIALTPDEFTASLPSYYLDLALDAEILHDTDGYLAAALARLREIINEAGLRRRWLDADRREYVWEWTARRPRLGKWAITWEGYRDVA